MTEISALSRTQLIRFPALRHVWWRIQFPNVVFDRKGTTINNVQKYASQKLVPKNNHHEVKKRSYKVREGKTPCIPDINNRRKWVINFTLRPFHTPVKISGTHISQEFGCPPEPLELRRQKSLCLPRIEPRLLSSYSAWLLTDKSELIYLATAASLKHSKLRPGGFHSVSGQSLRTTCVKLKLYKDLLVFEYFGFSLPKSLA